MSEDDDSDAKVKAADEAAPDSDESESGPDSDSAPAVAAVQPTKTAYRGDGPSKSGARKPVASLWQRATYRWTAITAVMAALLILYTQHPYYLGQQFAPFRPFYTFAFVVWLALGLFYVRATLVKFSGTRYVVRDGALHLLMLARSLRDPGGGERPQDATARSFRRGAFGAGIVALASFGLRFVGVPLRIEDTLAGVVGLRPNAISFVVGLVMLLTLGGGIAAFVSLFERGWKRRFWRLATKPRIRTTLLGIIVKGFYTPLMIGFFSGHANGIAEAWLRHKHLQPLKFVLPKGNALVQAIAWFDQLKQRIPELVPAYSDLQGFFAFSTWTRADISWGLGVAYDITFFIDCGWALIGYTLESRWMGNKTRSVEPTVLGWAAALSCYPPYNNVLGTYLPLENGPQWIKGEDTLLWLRGIIVVLFFVYATATVAFGFKFSNLTNRGIVSRGPYRFIRHPAYVCKCTAWWLEHLPTLTFTKAFFLSLLCCVYALRAWTEERHLSRDPDYLAYKKKVPWVIIPGVY